MLGACFRGFPSLRDVFTPEAWERVAGCEATPGHGRQMINNPGGVEGSGAFAPLPGCVFVMKRVVPGCVLRTTRGYRLPSLRDERGEGGVRVLEFLGLRPVGMSSRRSAGVYNQ